MKVQDLFRCFGITKKYQGYDQAILAIDLVMEDESRLSHITKEIYWEVAEKCSCNWFSVERNIRTISHRAWHVNKNLLIEMAGYELLVQPSTSEFIAILSSYLKRTEAKAV